MDKTATVEIATDKETGTRFDDWVDNESNAFDIFMDSWSQVCDKCAKEHHLLDTYIEIGAACPGTTCGVEGCQNEAEHYYDFDRVE